MNNPQILSIIQDLGLDQEFREFLQDTDEYSQPVSTALTNWFDEQSFNDDEEKVLALMEHTGDEYWDCNSAIDDTYLVLTDDEAEEAWDESLEHYLDELILPELPEQAQRYFDRTAWKSDAKYDGRGHSLATYDGHEHEQTIAGTTYYIYRIG